MCVWPRIAIEPRYVKEIEEVNSGGERSGSWRKGREGKGREGKN